MKKILLFLMVAVFTLSNLQLKAQISIDEFDSFNPSSQVGGNLGYSNIGGENYVSMRLQPELSFGKWGLGLNIPLYFNLENGEFRKDEYQDAGALWRMIMYVRYGVKKHNPIYAKVGMLTNEFLGYGMLINNYDNSASFDKRRTGVSADILIKEMVGFEFIYSDFDNTSMNLLAVRPYIRPFSKSPIKVISKFDVGFSYVTDHDETSVEIDGVTYKNQFIKDGMSAWAIDAGTYLINRKILIVSPFISYGNLNKNESPELKETLNYLATEMSEADSTHIVNYDKGTGFSVGIRARLNFLGNVLRADARIERLWYSDYFLPQFFDAGYTISKDAKVLSLAGVQKKAGIYGSASVSVIDMLMFSASLLIPDGVNEMNPGSIQLILHSKEIGPFIISGQYYKGGLSSFSTKEIFNFDERSLATTRIAYKVNKYLTTGFDYKWSWARNDKDVFETSNYISPYVGFRFPFGNQEEQKVDSDDTFEY
jgi:hypothetical protein